MLGKRERLSQTKFPSKDYSEEKAIKHQFRHPGRRAKCPGKDTDRNFQRAPLEADVPITILASASGKSEARTQILGFKVGPFS